MSARTRRDALGIGPSRNGGGDRPIWMSGQQTDRATETRILGSQRLRVTGRKDAMRDGWYYDEGEKPVGPLSFDALVTLLRRVSNAGEVKVWHAGFHEWQAAKDVSQIADLLYRRPLPIPRQILTSPVKAQPAERGDANNRWHKTRGRIALLIVLATVLFVGTIFSTVIHDISAGGVGYLIGQFIGAAVILSLLAWPWRRSPYIAAVVLLVATFSVGLGNTQELLFRLAVRETTIRSVSGYVSSASNFRLHSCCLLRTSPAGPTPTGTHSARAPAGPRRQRSA